MKTAINSHDERVLFRLDFALRGHAAYIHPHDFESLVSLVEHTVLGLGAPLLRYLETHGSDDSGADKGAVKERLQPLRMARRIRSQSIHPPMLSVLNPQGSPDRQHGESPMSFFNTILEKLGLGAAAAASATSPAQQGSPGTATTNTASAPAPVVDVTAKLDQLAKSNPQKLNWKTSIVDLLKLLNLDSSLESRKKLAQELGYSGSSDDSAQMNMWLHKAVLKKIADSGGNVPKDLL